jgi:hypothetical protein
MLLVFYHSNRGYPKFKRSIKKIMVFQFGGNGNYAGLEVKK